MRRPETTRLEISCGDWLLVKKHLTAGESRRAFSNMMRRGVTGDVIDPVKVGLSKMCVYLLDWSFTDAEDQPLVLRGQSEEVIASMLDALPPEDFSEVLAAIEAHDDAMSALRREEKKTRDGDHTLSPISPSLGPLVGATSGSES